MEKKGLTGFIGVKGKRALPGMELAVVGRATNGWINNWSYDQLSNDNTHHKIIENIINDSQKYPFNEVYRNTSAFWRVIRKVADKIGIPGTADTESNKWLSHIAWTNLYKIAPWEGKNPSERLCKAQEKGCIDLLKHELDIWQPKRVLFITGWNWAKPFLDKIVERKPNVETVGINVEAIGKIGNQQVVVAKRPEKRNEADWVRDVCNAFDGTILDSKILFAKTS